MKTIMKMLIILIIGAMMTIPVSATTYHSSGSDVGATEVLNSPNSWAKPWVGVPQWTCGTWEIHGYIYYQKGAYYYTASGTTYLSAWRRMYGWIYYHPYITSHNLHGGWYS